MIRISNTSPRPMVHLTTAGFLGDSQGSTFADVALTRTPQLFDQIICFFDDEAIHQRMVDSQIHNDRPPLAGVVADLEHEDWFDRFVRNTDAHDTQRPRQAVGVLVKIIMENYGFSTTGEKASLGTRAKGVPPNTTIPGAYHNTEGVSLWFTETEVYTHPDHLPVAERAKSLPKF